MKQSVSGLVTIFGSLAALVMFITVSIVQYTFIDKVQAKDLNDESLQIAKRNEIILAMSPGNQDKAAPKRTDSDNPFAGDETAIKRGGITYAGNCGLCHNGGGIGAKGPQLIYGSWAPDGPNSDRVMFNIISNGRKGTAMGAFKGHLSEKQIWEIIAYLRNESRLWAEKQKNEPEEDTFRR